MNERHAEQSRYQNNYCLSFIVWLAVQSRSSLNNYLYYLCTYCIPGSAYIIFWLFVFQVGYRYVC